MTKLQEWKQNLPAKSVKLSNLEAVRIMIEKFGLTEMEAMVRLYGSEKKEQ
jgi:hypothetical protein